MIKTFILVAVLLFVSLNVHASTIVLRWDPPLNSIVTGYRIYGVYHDATTFLCFSTTQVSSQTTSYSTTINEGQAYTYFVTALSGDEESGPSNAISIICETSGCRVLL